MMTLMKSLARRLPVLRGLIVERDTLRGQLQSLLAGHNALEEQYAALQEQYARTVRFVPPGHFYSPIPSEEDIHSSQESMPLPDAIPGIDLRTEEQLLLLDQYDTYYKELPFPHVQEPSFRYYYENPAYSYSDGIFLYCMMRHLKPRQIIEVGSGYSSCLMLDTNERFLLSQTKFVFIEPFAKLLHSLIRESDREKVTIHEVPLQEIPLEMFRQLEENDILFIDSTHVAKFRSDVNYIIHELLPVLRPGVYVHIHDIFYPFEYPRSWLVEGRAWNEQYMLRAFLEYNDRFEVVLFNTYLQLMFRERLQSRYPLVFRNTGGSIWIRRKA